MHWYCNIGQVSDVLWRFFLFGWVLSFIILLCKHSTNVCLFVGFCGFCLFQIKASFHKIITDLNASTAWQHVSPSLPRNIRTVLLRSSWGNRDFWWRNGDWGDSLQFPSWFYNNVLHPLSRYHRIEKVKTSKYCDLCLVPLGPSFLSCPWIVLVLSRNQKTFSSCLRLLHVNDRTRH